MIKNIDEASESTKHLKGFLNSTMLGLAEMIAEKRDILETNKNLKGTMIRTKEQIKKEK
jgi:hypothetical protein